jgi:hypothetical protein
MGKEPGASAPQARPRVGHVWPPRPEVSGEAALNREDEKKRVMKCEAFDDRVTAYLLYNGSAT